MHFSSRNARCDAPSLVGSLGGAGAHAMQHSLHILLPTELALVGLHLQQAELELHGGGEASVAGFT